jgi:sugar/nucleoside kinase (ribokinase family)
VAFSASSGISCWRSLDGRARKAGCKVTAAPIARLADTTGAGDLYASGFLYGLTGALPLPICGEIGSLCAAEITSHFGARSEVDLSQLLAESGRT